MELQFIKCHGSGNDFVMVDAVARRPEGLDPAGLARKTCDRRGPLGADGLLLAVRDGSGYAMRMYNPDGSEAEMCGNGIRCVARLVRRYVNADRFPLRSGGKAYAVAREADIASGVPTYSVRIPVAAWSPDFAMFGEGETWLRRPIPELDPELHFTALSLGNPHIVARVGKIDTDRLQMLGRKVADLKNVFPNGVNISMYEVAGPRELLTATFERGAGLTLSCGTAMTACTTAAVITGDIEEHRPVRVRNRGGMVVCTCDTEPAPATELKGNATFEFAGTLRDDGEAIVVETVKRFDAEIEAYDLFAQRERMM